MRRKLRAAEGRALYKLRKAIVEPVFGQIKAARGLRRFLLRGYDKARHEWSLIALTHNLLKLFRSEPLPPKRKGSPRRSIAIEPYPPNNRSPRHIARRRA